MAAMGAAMAPAYSIAGNNLSELGEAILPGRYNQGISHDIPLMKVWQANENCRDGELNDGHCLEERAYTKEEKALARCTSPAPLEKLLIQHCYLPPAREGRSPVIATIIDAYNFRPVDKKSSKIRESVESSHIQLIAYNQGEIGLDDYDYSQTRWRNPSTGSLVTHTYFLQDGITEHWQETSPKGELHENYKHTRLNRLTRILIAISGVKGKMTSKYEEVVLGEAEDSAQKHAGEVEKLVDIGRNKIIHFLEWYKARSQDK